MTAGDMLELEEEIRAAHMESARKEMEARLQAVADGFPPVDGGGRPLSRRERIGMQVRSCFGVLNLQVVSGWSEAERRSVTPARRALFEGRRGAMTPLLERNVTVAALEAGSFEKGASLCACWGVKISDDKARTTVESVAERCLAGRLPKRCGDAAGKDDTLIAMADGWNVRLRGPKWGLEDAQDGERVTWKDVKSATIFKAADIVPDGARRRALLHKRVVAVPADAGPEVFGAALEREAVRMGMDEARRTYFFSDGGAYLWNIFECRFEAVAVGTLDYYHAMEHLGEAAAHLFPDVGERAEWLKARRAEVKERGGGALGEMLSDLLAKLPVPAEGVEVVEREARYFEKHKRHMDYDRRASEGLPIGSGAVESLCGQFQNRLKRRGQFWSRKGFADILRAYVWHMNGDLDLAISPQAA